MLLEVILTDISEVTAASFSVVKHLNASRGADVNSILPADQMGFNGEWGASALATPTLQEETSPRSFSFARMNASRPPAIRSS